MFPVERRQDMDEEALQMQRYPKSPSLVTLGGRYSITKALSSPSLAPYLLLPQDYTPSDLRRVLSDLCFNPTLLIPPDTALTMYHLLT